MATLPSYNLSDGMSKSQKKSAKVCSEAVECKSCNGVIVQVRIVLRCERKRVHLDLREVGSRWLGEVGKEARNTQHLSNFCPCFCDDI